MRADTYIIFFCVTKVQSMLQMGPIDNEGTALVFAVRDGHLNVIKYLVEEAKANPEKANEV